MYIYQKGNTKKEGSFVKLSGKFKKPKQELTDEAGITSSRL